jgi:hypothetical protein
MSRIRKRTSKAIEGDREIDESSAPKLPRGSKLSIAESDSSEDEVTNFISIKAYKNAAIFDNDARCFFSDSPRQFGKFTIAQIPSIGGVKLTHIRDKMELSADEQCFLLTDETAIPRLPRFSKAHNLLRKILDTEIIKDASIDVIVVDKQSHGVGTSVPQKKTASYNDVPRMSMDELRENRLSSNGQPIVVHLILGAVCNDGKILAERVAKKNLSNASR